MSVAVKAVFEASDEETGKVTGRLTWEGFGLELNHRNAVNQEAINFAQNMLNQANKQ